MQKLSDKVALYSLEAIFIKTAKLHLPYYKGNLVRGLLGNSLKELHCTNTKETNCNNCKFKYTCKFAYLFQGILPDKSFLPDKYQHFSNFPSMFVLDEIIDNFNTFKIKLNFIGNIGKYFNDILQMLINIKNYKPDRYSKGRFLLHSVKVGENYVFSDDEIISDKYPELILNDISKQYLILEFITPTRITLKGKHIMDDLNNETLIKKITERANLLILLYSVDKTLPELTVNAIEISDKKLRWIDLRHNSNRQKRAIKMGGFVGEIKIKINEKNIIPLLQLTEIMHIGANVKAGYGKFAIREKE